MQAKIFKENSLNKLNALKSTTQLLDRQSIWYQEAFARLFGDSFRTFKFQLSQHMNNLETLLNAETLHEMDSKSALKCDIKIEKYRKLQRILLKMTAQTFKETIIQNMNSIEQCLIERASHEQELSDGEKSGIVSDEEIEKQGNGQDITFHAKIQEVLPKESVLYKPLEQIVQLILFIVDSGCTKKMMSDHNSSDLAPQRQEMSVENVSSGLVPQGQKASDYDNSDPVPPRQNVVPSAEKTYSSQQ
ncbi:hypothetical protein Tco_1127712, partial [Tanacetum coccineum]